MINNLSYGWLMLGMLGINLDSSAHSKQSGWGNQSFMPLNPPLTYSPSDSTTDYPIAPSGEFYLPLTSERLALHMESHDYFPIITAVIPPLFNPPVLDTIEKYLITPNEMVVINPGGEEIIHVMEGKRHGFENMSISITNTLPGRGAPLHTHVGEEAHVVLKGSVRYFMKGQVFTVNAPYIVHIPPMTPHAFQNISTSIVNIVGVFGSNQWEYDLLNYPAVLDNTNPNTGTCRFNIINEWDKGAQAQISVTNSTPETFADWSLNWLFSDGSTRVKHAIGADVKGNNPYTLAKLSSDKPLQAGQTVKFELLLSKADTNKPAQVPLLQGSLCKN